MTEDIDAIFDRIEIQGVSTNDPLLYGYFFIDNDTLKLKRIKNELLGKSYRFVEYLPSEDKYILHMEKVERHSRASLLKAELELKEMAIKFKVESFDGFDVGNADPQKPLVTTESFATHMSGIKDEELFNFGSRLLSLSIWDNAELVFKECIRKQIKLDTSNYNLGCALDRQSKTPEAIAAFENAVKINPKYFQAYYYLGIIFYDSYSFQKSLASYEVADRLQPNSDSVLYGMAAAQFALEQYGKSLANCKKVIAINPKNENAPILMGMLNSKGIK